MRHDHEQNSAEQRRAVGLALAAAVLFGASAPLAKLLLTNAAPQLLAGLLYLGSGIGLGVVWLRARNSAELVREHRCTTVIVSHDPESARVADRIVRTDARQLPATAIAGTTK